MLSSISSPPTVANTAATRPITGAAPAVGAAQATDGATGDFASVLGQMAMDAIGVVKQGEQTAAAGVRGQATTQQVVEAVMAAEQTLQAGISIRDKVVSAYLEISRMSI